MSAAGADVREGSVLGRYELLLRIAQGGMACVWAARLHGTRGFRKLVAIKTILPGVMGEERLEHMFLEEASLAAGIDHPNVVDTIELGEHDGTMFMVLEWVDGEPLSTVLVEAQQHGGIPLPIGVNLIAQACKGLHAAHELKDANGAPLGLVHRDVSPHNLLVTYNGIVKVLDFGIAKATEKASSLTEAGEIKGKLAFMAPEQVRGREVDRRTDVFALGTLLYVVTTGRHPWKGENPGETAQRLVSERPVKPPSAYRDGYPEALEAVVLKALEKDPEKRFGTAAELLSALDDAVPSSLEGNAEARVAEYMQGLVGPKGVERRKKIRLAGDLLDQQRDPAHAVITSSTSGSTSAVAFDKSASSSMPAHSSLGPSSAQGVPAVAVERRRRFVWLGAVAVAGCLGVVARGALDHGERDTPRAASSPVPHAELPAPPPPTPSNLPAPAATDTSAPIDSADVDAVDPRAERRQKARAAASHFVPGVDGKRAVALGATPAASAPTPASPSGTPDKAPAPRTSADAWNPQTFGNRY